MTEEMRRRTRRDGHGEEWRRKERQQGKRRNRGEGRYSCTSLWLFMDDVDIMVKENKALSYMSKFLFIFNTNKNKPH